MTNVLNKNFNGESVEVSGELLLADSMGRDGIQIDLNGVEGRGGHYCSLFLSAGGPFEVVAPKGAGQVQLKIFLGDPHGDPRERLYYEYGPFVVGDTAIEDLEVDLRDKTLPKVASQPAPQGPPPENKPEEP